MTRGTPVPDETIFALTTGGGRAAVAIIRISGPHAGSVLQQVSGRQQLSSRRVERAILRDVDGGALDDALVVWFPGPFSFTGEDVAELHVHGGRAVVAAVLATLSAKAGLRPAEPGEFTRRAFENGKLDLTQVEGLADLVGAETERQRRQALRQLGGALGTLYDGWRTTLIDCMARLEACIDFSDEDIPESVEATVRADVAGLRALIARHLCEPPSGQRIRDGVSVVLIGAPNAGKSTLLNALAGRDVAIVDPAPGTTRDALEAPVDFDGVPVVLTDTAGLRSSDDRVEQEGIRRATARAAAADVTIAVFDAARWPEVDPATAAMLDARSVVVLAKTDLLADGVGPAAVAGRPAIGVSAWSGSGMDSLRAAVGQRLTPLLGESEVPAITRARHRQGVEACCTALTRFAEATSIETQAEELRVAARALGRITGRVDVEDILDVLFRDFCIGK